MLLLVQNEVGQLMWRTLTMFENRAETEALLKTMVPKMSSEKTPMGLGYACVTTRKQTVL
jgi:hypothetical protein